jgi:hypothetical protein
MRKTLKAVVLVLIFCCPVVAGIIHNPPPEPEPTPTSAVQEQTVGQPVDGEISTPGVSDTLTEIALDVLAVLPSLL